MIDLLLIFLATLAGFSTHRANLCMVKAVIELVSSRSGYIFMSYIKVILWVLVFALPIRWLTNVEYQEYNYSLTLISLLGGLIFGLGMTLNGSCAFSTLSRLANGEVKMLSTLLGFSLGIVVWFVFFENQHNLTIEHSILDSPNQIISWIILALLVFWACYEIFRLINSRDKAATFIQLLISPIYRLSTSALLIGGTGGILFILQGHWGYTSTLNTSIEGYFNPQSEVPVFQLILFLAIVFGMWLSSFQRRQFNWSFKVNVSWISCFIGGMLMGTGGAMIPGGNDSLLLHSIPSFSPHSVPSFLAIILGAALPIWIVRKFTGNDMKIDCSGDICQ